MHSKEDLFFVLDFRIRITLFIGSVFREQLTCFLFLSALITIGYQLSAVLDFIVAVFIWKCTIII